MHRLRERAAIVSFALALLAALVGVSFALGYLVGKVLL